MFQTTGRAIYCDEIGLICVLTFLPAIQKHWSKMIFWSLSRAPATRDYVRAGILTAVIPVALAFASYWLAPWGCDASAWLCLLPLSLLGVAPIAALCLPLLFYFNRRRLYPLPDGWFSIVLSTGVVAQGLVTGYSLWLAAPHIRRIFLFDVLVFPQGFVAGLIVGAVFWVSLIMFARSRQES